MRRRPGAEATVVRAQRRRCSGATSAAPTGASGPSAGLETLQPRRWHTGCSSGLLSSGTSVAAANIHGETTMHRQNPERSPLTVTALAATLLLACSIAAPSLALDQEDAEVARVLDAYIEAYTGAEALTLAALYTDDARFEDVTQADKLQGRIAMEQAWSAIFHAHVEPPRLEIIRRIAVAGQGVLEVIYAGTVDGAVVGAPGQTRDYRFSAVLLFEIADGKIARQTDYIDIDRYRATLSPPPVP
jgi:steroid delta-isomerase-like uncharacterized protein